MAYEDIFLNPNAGSQLPSSESSSNTDGDTDINTILAFHSSLPHYAPTPLVHLSSLSDQLGCQVYLKDESSRLNLPSFKILGASWGVFRALCDLLSLPPTTSLSDLRSHLTTCVPAPHLFAATDGNHGRAVAYMASLFGLRCTIYVPRTLRESTCSLIRREGPLVKRSAGNYDGAVHEAAAAAASAAGGLLIQDTAWENYTRIPAWIVAGYGTMLREIASAVDADAIVCPVGVGSLASAVAQHCYPRATIVCAEPATAACLFASLQKGHPVAVATPGTIMTGMDCGTVSSAAFPLLRRAVHACVKVHDHEAHRALADLRNCGVTAGPCGSAPLAALRKAVRVPLLAAALRAKTVVLLCTEGQREYDVPATPQMQSVDERG